MGSRPTSAAISSTKPSTPPSDAGSSLPRSCASSSVHDVVDGRGLTPAPRPSRLTDDLAAQTAAQRPSPPEVGRRAGPRGGHRSGPRPALDLLQVVAAMLDHARD